MRIVIVDASRLKDKKTSHGYLKEVFGFPDYYGCNLDALHDCLTEIRDLRILIKNVNNAGAYFLNVYPVFLRDGRAILF